jgi:hypothetical protein
MILPASAAARNALKHLLAVLALAGLVTSASGCL